MHEVQEEYLVHPVYQCVTVQEVLRLESLMETLIPMVIMIDIPGCTRL